MKIVENPAAFFKGRSLFAAVPGGIKAISSTLLGGFFFCVVNTSAAARCPGGYRLLCDQAAETIEEKLCNHIHA